jgi:hypothetical protein
MEAMSDLAVGLEASGRLAPGLSVERERSTLLGGSEPPSS